MDDPLWVIYSVGKELISPVLIPLLVDDPLWAEKIICNYGYEKVLIPLLVDDPLWAARVSSKTEVLTRLNPSFSG